MSLNVDAIPKKERRGPKSYYISESEEMDMPHRPESSNIHSRRNLTANPAHDTVSHDFQARV